MQADRSAHCSRSPIEIGLTRRPPSSTLKETAVDWWAAADAGQRSIERRHGWHATSWQGRHRWIPRDFGRYELGGSANRQSTSAMQEVDAVALTLKPRWPPSLVCNMSSFISVWLSRKSTLDWSVTWENRKNYSTPVKLGVYFAVVWVSQKYTFKTQILQHLLSFLFLPYFL